MTAVPNVTFGPTGFTAPAHSAILAGVLADLQGAFGGGLNIVTPSTPQYQFAVSLAAIVADSYDQFALMANNVDPAFASGRAQDAIGRIYFLSRQPATSTVVTATITGKAGTSIYAGALAVATDGTLYSCTSPVVIPAGGTISATFAASATGPITCPGGTLTTIYRSIPGWDTITNPAPGVTGVAVETTAAFRARMTASVAGNSFGALGSILGAVAAVPGIIDYWGAANYTASPVTVSGVTVPANGVYISVYGGTSAAVALAIFTKIGPCNMGGNTTATVTDPSPLYASPPTYSITYEQPVATAIFFAVSIANSPAVPANAATLINAAISAAFLGQDSGQRARIATTIYAARFYAGIAALGSWAQLISVFVGTAASPTGSSAAMTGAQLPYFTIGNASLTLV